MAKSEYQEALEVLALFDAYTRKDPRMAGEPHPNLPTVWVFQTPSGLLRFPQLALLYTIEDGEGMVTLWNLYRID